MWLSNFQIVQCRKSNVVTWNIYFAASWTMRGAGRTHSPPPLTEPLLLCSLEDTGVSVAAGDLLTYLSTLYCSCHQYTCQYNGTEQQLTSRPRLHAFLRYANTQQGLLLSGA